MKTLVVFYSRTGTTKAVAERLVEALGCDSEEIVDTKNRRGSIGFLRSGYDAVKRRLTTIKPTRRDPSEYNLVVVGTPVWVGTFSAAVRTYLYLNQNLPENVAFFCTYGRGSEDAEKVFAEMQRVSKRKPVAVMGLKANDVKKGVYEHAIQRFVDEIKGSARQVK